MSGLYEHHQQELTGSTGTSRPQAAALPGYRPPEGRSSSAILRIGHRQSCLMSDWRCRAAIDAANNIYVQSADWTSDDFLKTPEQHFERSSHSASKRTLPDDDHPPSGTEELLR